MQVSSQIDQLISSLKELKPVLSEDKDENTKKFSELLQKSLEITSSDKSYSKATSELEGHKRVDEIPPWVDQNYGYDPANPRKPNMRELMEALSGKNLEDLYSEPNENWKTISRNASELLYNVVETGSDPRDWSEIMKAEDTLEAARVATGKLHEPKVDIDSIYNNGELVNQIAVLRDKNGNALRIVPNNTALANETLRNFGATYASVPSNIEEKVITEKFNNELLNFLKSFGKNPEKPEVIALQATTDAISERLAEEIYLDELEKL